MYLFMCVHIISDIELPTPNSPATFLREIRGWTWLDFLKHPTRRNIWQPSARRATFPKTLKFCAFTIPGSPEKSQEKYGHNFSWSKAESVPLPTAQQLRLPPWVLPPSPRGGQKEADPEPVALWARGKIWKFVVPDCSKSRACVTCPFGHDFEPLSLQVVPQFACRMLATSSVPKKLQKWMALETSKLSSKWFIAQQKSQVCPLPNCGQKWAIPAPKTVRNCPAIKPNAQEFRPSRRKISPKPEKLDFYVTKKNAGPGIGDFFRVMNTQTLGRPSLGRLGSRSAPRQSPWRVEAWRIAQAAQAENGPKLSMQVYMHAINAVLSSSVCVCVVIPDLESEFLIWNQIFWFATRFSFFSHSDLGTRRVWSDHHMCLPWNLNVRFHMEKSLVKCSHLFSDFGIVFFLYNLEFNKNRKFVQIGLFLSSYLSDLEFHMNGLSRFNQI